MQWLEHMCLHHPPQLHRQPAPQGERAEMESCERSVPASLLEHSPPYSFLLQVTFGSLKWTGVCFVYILQMIAYHKVVVQNYHNDSLSRMPDRHHVLVVRKTSSPAQSQKSWMEADGRRHNNITGWHLLSAGQWESFLYNILDIESHYKHSNPSNQH